MHTPPHSSPQSNYSKKSPVSDAACQGGARMYKPEGMQQLHICCVVQQHDALNAWASPIQMGSSATAYATQVGFVSCDQQLATSIMQHDTTLVLSHCSFLKQVNHIQPGCQALNCPVPASLACHPPNYCTYKMLFLIC